MRVDPELLKSALVKAIDDHLRMHGADLLSIDKDLYWRVADHEAFNVHVKPAELEIGNLPEEYSAIEADVRSGELLGSVSLQHLSSILLWLSARAGGCV